MKTGIEPTIANPIKRYVSGGRVGSKLADSVVPNCEIRIPKGLLRLLVTPDQESSYIHDEDSRHIVSFLLSSIK
jgi:hypothetical protein